MSGHTCHARGCDIPVMPERLLCYAHWLRVPLKIQQAVWRSYRPGQCDDKRPSKEWFLAADAAIGFVARGDRKRISISEASALEHFGFGDKRIKAGLKLAKELSKAPKKERQR